MFAMAMLALGFWIGRRTSPWVARYGRIRPLGGEDVRADRNYKVISVATDWTVGRYHHDDVRPFLVVLMDCTEGSVDLYRLAYDGLKYEVMMAPAEMVHSSTSVSGKAIRKILIGQSTE